MKLVVLGVGRLKSGPEKELAADYQARIPPMGKKCGVTDLTIRDIAESQLPNAEQRMKAEADWLWGQVPQGATTIILDERGTSLDSVAFSKLIGGSADRGVSSLCFMIGGPDGHDPTTRSRAQHIINFGPMTWPHRLVRVMLLEQIYRGLTILNNHPYHRV